MLILFGKERNNHPSTSTHISPPCPTFRQSDTALCVLMKFFSLIIKQLKLFSKKNLHMSESVSTFASLTNNSNKNEKRNIFNLQRL